LRISTKITVLFFLLIIFFSCKKNEPILFNETHFSSLAESKKEKYLDSIINLLKSKKNDSVTRSLYLKIASEYYYLNNSKKSLNSSLKALELSRLANDSVRMAKSLYYAGDCYEYYKKDSAYFYYLKAEKIYKKIHDHDNVGRMLFNKAHVLFYDGNYVECEIEASKALHYLKKSTDHELVYSCNTLMGNCLERLSNYNKALQYHKQALAELKKMKANDVLNDYYVSSIVNICNLYDLKGEYSKSIKKLQGLLSKDLKKKPLLYANVLSNLAYSRMRSGDYKNVESMFSESLKIVDSIGIESYILYKKIYIGEFFLTQKDTAKSIQVLKEANQLAIKIKSSNEILSSLKLLSEIDRKNSLYYTNYYIKVSDSINAVQKNAHDKYARIEYETSRIEDENKVLTKKNLYILISSFILILLFLIILVLRYSKYKNKELQFLIEQKKANEEIYLLLMEQKEQINIARENEKAKIARELHDGVMNRIYGIRMNLGFFNSKNSEEIIEKRKGYITELQNVENEIRMISHELNQNSFFEGNDFDTLLMSLINDQKDISPVHFKCIVEDSIDWTSIENIYKINLYRIIQESILNVNKYSNATNCEIKIQKKDGNSLKLTIIDDGDGFNIKTSKSGIGLTNMKNRTLSLQGKFKIKSKISRGTKIIATFNLDTIVVDT
jgi:signal transduction histidine kinase